MGDRRRATRALQPLAIQNGALTASVRSLTGPSAMRTIIQNREWQREVWDFYHAMGEFWYGTTWLSSTISRVRLKAAIMRPGVDEPEIIPEDAAGTDRKVLEIVAAFGGGTTGQASIMKSLAVQLSIPGEGYVVAEDINGDRIWSTKSADEIRRRQGGKTQNRTERGMQVFESEFEIQIEEGAWRPLNSESLVFRIWQPDEQLSWRAASAALPALPILRELDLYNRRIITDLVSRLASNGILIMPQEVTFPVRPEFKDAPDPLIQEFIELASKSIANPGAASGAIPIPLRVPAEMVDKFQHLTFASLFDPQILDARDRTLKRLAVTLNMPMEALMGVADVNHWTAWQIDESGIKIHISPLCEIMCHGYTMSYLRPTLESSGILPITSDGGRYVIWYDTTELSSKPDLTQNANDAYDRLEISATAYRREMGFSEEDKPENEDLKDQVLKLLIAKNGSNEAVKELVGLDIAPPPPPMMPGAPVPGEKKELPSGTPNGTPKAIGPPTPKKPTFAIHHFEESEIV